MPTLRERIETVRTTAELFPRCVKCNADLSGERLSNLVSVLGRENRLMHHACPRPASEAAD